MSQAASGIVVNGTGTPGRAGYNPFWPYLLTNGFLAKSQANSTIHVFYSNYNLNLSRSGKYLSGIDWSTANTDTDWGSAAWVQVGGNWFQLGNTYTPQTTASTNTNPFTTYTQNYSQNAGEVEAVWHLVTINPETSSGANDGGISVNPVATTLPTGAPVTGVAIIFKRATGSSNQTRLGRIRLRMEPSTLVQTSGLVTPFLYF